MAIDADKVRLTTLRDQEPDFVFNQVWEVTRMTWPTPFPEKLDRTKVKLIRAGERLSGND